jgi:hypothetical protein
MRSVIAFVSLITLSVPACAGDYYVDADNGSDATGDGSAGNPWKTINYAFSQVSAYDGDGVDTLNLTGEFYEEDTATAQSDDDGVTITGGTFGGDDINSITVDVSAADNTSITGNNFLNVTIYLGDGATVSDNGGEYPDTGYRAGIYATNKDNITVEDNDILPGEGEEDYYTTHIYVNVTGGSGHNITGNYASWNYIYCTDVTQGTVSNNFGDTYHTGAEMCFIHCDNSSVDLIGNYCSLDITGGSIPYVYDNSFDYLDINVDAGDALELISNYFEAYNNMGNYYSITLNGEGVCRFTGNSFYIEGGYFPALQVELHSGPLLIETCSVEEDSSYSMDDWFLISGGTADFGGGPLGSTGGNDFTEGGCTWGYFIRNDTPEDVFALYNTWNPSIESQIDDHYYDTYNIEEFYDKWEDAAKGFIIWSGPDPNGPVPAFNLLSPENGEVVDTLTPTVDWENVPECPWVDFDHFDLYVDTDPGFGDADVYGGLTESEHTFSDPLEDGTTYYWKVLAFDDEGNDRWSEQIDWSFTVSTGSLGDFSLLSPEQGETVHTLTPTLDWEDSVPGYGVRGLDYSAHKGTGALYSRNGGRACELDHYDVWLGTDPDYTNPIIYTDITDSTFTLTENLDDQTDYYWKVVAVDNLDREKWCTELDWWFHVDEAGHLSDFSLLSPAKGETVTALMPTLDWEDSIPEYGGGRSTLSVLKKSAVSHRADGIYTGWPVPRNGEGRLCELDHYDLWVDTDPNYGNADIYAGLTDSTYTFADDLDDQTAYYWKVVAVDDQGRETWCIELDWWFKTDTTLKIVPASFGRIKASFTDGATPIYSTGESESRMGQQILR